MYYNKSVLHKSALSCIEGLLSQKERKERVFYIWDYRIFNPLSYLSHRAVDEHRELFIPRNRNVEAACQ